MQLGDWRAAEARIDREQVLDEAPLLDRLPPDFVASLTPSEALALTHDPRAYLRARQILPEDGSWLQAVLLTGRGWGKSFAAAGWLIQRILASSERAPSLYYLVAPTLPECWSLQWDVIESALPPWVRYRERRARGEIHFPDHGVTLRIHSAEVPELRGPNLSGAWCEEPIKWSRGATLWGNLSRALRIGDRPRAVFTTTPPREIDWLLELCASPSTMVVRGTMRDNPTLNKDRVADEYRRMRGTIEGERELDGKVVIGVDGALFKLDDLERFRVAQAPRLEQIVVAVDPAQSAGKDADRVGIVVLGIAAGHLFVPASCSERLDPADWATRAIEWASEHRAGRFVVEPTGSGAYPRATLDAQMRIMGVTKIPIVESKARGSKADRAQPLSAACAQGRLHMVGRQSDLERELTTWYPGARFSPGGLDALVHGAATLTNNWKAI